MGKATMDKMNALHDMLATYYTDLLEQGEEVSSGTLAAINTFLKNNNITTDELESQPMQNLTDKIKDMLKREA